MPPAPLAWPEHRNALVGRTIRPPSRQVYSGQLIVQNLMLRQGFGYTDAQRELQKMARKRGPFLIIT